MLRMGGIPARVATGFSPGGYSESKQAWIVRDTDAHAWVEVWFDQYGWVTLDPTPSATPARSRVAVDHRRAAVLHARHARQRRRQRHRRHRRHEPAAVRPDLQVGTGTAPRPPTTAGVPALAALASAIVLVVLALVLAVVLFIRRPRGTTPMDRAIAEVEDALRRVGRPVSTGTTLRELERRLGSHSPEVAAYLRALSSGRYAPVPRAAFAERPARPAAGVGPGPRVRRVVARAVGDAAARGARVGLVGFCAGRSNSRRPCGPRAA